MEELNTPHTALLRLGLAAPQSILFWQRALDDLPLQQLCRQASEEQWFPELSKARSNYLVGQMEKRFPFPSRELLGFRARPEPQQNLLVCHWHLQLSDPLYRSFCSNFLIGCWSNPTTSVSLEASTRWVEKQEIAHKWQASTIRRMASGLLSAASEAGLCSAKGRGERELRLPLVKPEDIDYLKALLDLAKARHHMPSYLMSVGKSDEQGEATHE